MNRIIYHLTAFLVVALWGTTFVYTKLLLMAGLTAAQIFVLRFIIAYVMLLAYSLPKKSFRLFASSWKDELLMAALGVIVMVLNGHFVLHLSPLGDTLAFMACLCWAFYSLLMIPANQRYRTLFITRKVFFYGLVFMIPYFMIWPGMPPLSVLMRPDVMGNLLFLGCIASMVCFLAWNWAMKKVGEVAVTNYVYFNPVTTVLFAWMVLSERITLYFIIGTVLILAGMYLCNKAEG